MGFTISLLLATMGVSQKEGKELTADQVIKKAIDHSNTIKTATVKLNLTTNRPGATPPQTEEKIAIWMAGERLRTDLFYAKVSGGPHTRDSYCRNCEKEGAYASYTEAAHNFVGLVTFGNLGDDKDKKMPIIDPRVLGSTASPASLIWRTYVGLHLTNMARTDLRLEQAKWKGEACYIVRYTLLTGGKGNVAVWIVPSMDYSIVRVDENGVIGVNPWQCSSVSEMKSYGKPGIWFPTLYTYVGSMNGEMLQRDTVTVVEALFNADIPNSVFKLTGMDIPAGIRVRGSALPSGHHVWNGQEIITQKHAPLRATGTDSVNAARPWLLGLSGFFILISGAAVCQAYRTRRR
jgi:hypothetical protein